VSAERSPPNAAFHSTYVALTLQSLFVMEVRMAVRVASEVVVPGASAAQVYDVSISLLPALSR
jgi:hypothetical protein